MLDTGTLDQLAALVTQTGVLRQLFLAAGAGLAGAGAAQSSVGEAVLGVVLVLVTGAVNQFVGYVRAKHSANLQAVVGVKPDQFIGPKTVAAAAHLATQATQLRAILRAEDDAEAETDFSEPPTPR